MPDPRPVTLRELLLAAAFYLALAAGGFLPTLFLGEVLFPLHTDQINPWRASVSPERLRELAATDNPDVTDKHWLFHPDNQVFARAVRAGRLPLWNPNVLSGTPYLGQLLCPVFYPPYWILARDHNEHAYGPLTALHFALAGLLAYCYLRNARLPPSASLFGGVAFAFCGPMWARAHYYMTFFPIVWLPLALFLVDRYTTGRSRRTLLLIAPVAALMLLAGFPQMAIYAFYLTVLYALCSGPARSMMQRLRDAIAVALLIGLGIALASVQLVPAVQALVLSMRGVQPTSELLKHALSLDSLATLLVPHAFGDPTWALDTRVTNWLKAAFLPDTADNFTESTIYLGVLPFVLVLGSWRTARGRVLLGLATLLLALAVMPAWLPGLVAKLPGLNAGDPRRTLLPAAGLLALAAGFGFAELVNARARNVLAAAAALLLAITGAALAWLWLDGGGVMQWIEARMTTRYGAIVADHLASLPQTDRAAIEGEHLHYLRVALVSAVVLTVAALGTIALARWRRVMPIVAVGVLVADLFAFGLPLNRGQSGEHFLARDPVIDKLQAIAADFEQRGDRLRLMRFVPKRGQDIDILADLVLNPNMGTHFGLEDSSGYITQVLMRYGRLFESFEAGTAVPVQVRPFLEVTSLTSHLPAIAALNVLLTIKPLDATLAPHFEKLFEDRGYFAYRCKDALPRVSVFGKARLFPPSDRYRESAVNETRDREIAVLKSNGFDPHAEILLEGAPEIAAQDGALPRATITRYAPEEVEIALAPGRAAYLYLADAYCPGWEALVDGVRGEVYPANVAFRGVVLPAGAKHVVLRYRPLDFWIGAVLTAIAALAWLVWFVRARPERAGRAPTPVVRPA